MVPCVDGGGQAVSRRAGWFVVLFPDVDLRDVAPELSSRSGLTVASSGPVIGAEVSGLDLREPLTSELRDELRRLLLRHRVLFLRDQQIDTGQQVAFAEGFGDVLVFRTGSDPHPVYPGVDQMGVHQLHPVPQAPPSETSRAQRFRWHIDASTRLVPPSIVVVRTITVPTPRREKSTCFSILF